ncbi:hypothetical protein ABW21_db0200285 [Orbilia brochopaga]|nr:hypothetical protein ABW21_db0200285 [Drechslerella brochopaga]
MIWISISSSSVRPSFAQPAALHLLTQKLLSNASPSQYRLPSSQKQLLAAMFPFLLAFLYVVGVIIFNPTELLAEYDGGPRTIAPPVRPRFSRIKVVPYAARGLDLPETTTVVETVTLIYKTNKVITSTIAICGPCSSAPSTSPTSSLPLCANVVATWEPFSQSTSPTATPISTASSPTDTTFSTSTVATTRTTAVTTSTISVSSPSNVFTLAASNTDAVDIDSTGNMILRNSVARQMPAFSLNSDGTLTSYGSDLILYADFRRPLPIRDLNVVYSLALCPAQASIAGRSHSAMGPIDSLSLAPRQASDIAYSTFALNSRILIFATGGSTYGFANCETNLISLYDARSNTLPNACSLVVLTAFSVPTVSYAQYFSLGLRYKSQFSNIATCMSLPSTSTGDNSQTESSTDVDTYSVPSELPTETDTGVAADFTSPTDPYPVFVLSVYELGSVLLDSSISQALVIGEATETFFTAFQLTPDSGMIIYGANFPVYANTSVELINDADKRAICYGQPIVLMAADASGLVPEGSTTGPFVTDPDIGLILIGWQFVVCDGSPLLQLVFFGCNVSSECFIVNPGLFALYGLFRDQALYNGGVVYRELEPTPTTPTLNPPVTSEVFETNAVEFARNVFLEGGYFDFCSSELGYYTTSVIVELETAPVSTETTESTTTVDVIDFSSTEVETVSTDTTDLTTTTTRLQFVSYYAITSRVVVWRTIRSTTTATTGTKTFTVTRFVETQVTTLTTVTVIPTTPRKRRAITVEAGERLLTVDARETSPQAPVQARETQALDLTPTALQFLDPGIISSGCVEFFDFLYMNLNGSTPSTYTYLTDTTSTVNGTSTVYTATKTSYASTSFNVVGTETTYVYTTTHFSTEVSTRVNVDYRYGTVFTTTTATDNVLYRVNVETAFTETITAGTTTTTTLQPGTTLLCPPAQVSPGGQMVSGVAQPFQNFTQPAFRGSSSSSANGIGYVYWGEMPANYPSAPFVGYGRAAPNETIYAWLRQDFKTCVGATYYIRVMYKWLYTSRTPQDVFNRTADYSAYGYALNVFQVVVSGTTEGSFYANPFADDGNAAKGNPGSADASSFTGSFVARYTSHTISLIFYWRNPTEIPRLVDSPFKFNQIYVYNFQVQAAPFGF